MSYEERFQRRNLGTQRRDSQSTGVGETSMAELRKEIEEKRFLKI